MKMKKFKALLCILALILALFVISGCKPETDAPETSEEAEKYWLEPPENLEFEGFTLSFDKVDEADGYHIVIEGPIFVPETGGRDTSLELDVYENVVDLSDRISPESNYSIGVCAFGSLGEPTAEFCPATITVSTEGVTPGLEFILNDDGESYTVSKGTSKTVMHLIFPDTYEGKPITKLTGHFGRYALGTEDRPLLGIYYIRLPIGLEEIDRATFCEIAITELRLPRALKVIKDHAFSHCYELETVIWPSSLRVIEEKAFADTGFKELTLPEGVETIGNGAFRYTHIEKFTLPSTVGLVDQNAFEATPWYDEQPDGPIYIGKTFYEYKNESGRPLPSEIVIREGTEYIAQYAFEGCTEITRVVLPEGLIGIQIRAFENCSALSDVKLPSTLKHLGTNAFAYCKITELTIPASVELMDFGAFSGCAELRRIIVESGVKALGKSAFLYCKALTEVSLPDTLEYIESRAFSNTAIEHITLPASLKKLDFSAFQGCSALSRVDTSKAETLVEIGSKAFADCPLLTSIIIPDSVEVLDDGIFSGTAITEIKLPENLTSLGAIFEGMGIKSVILPSKLQKIEKNAFKNCTDLTSVVFPNTLTEIGMSAFEGCTSLTGIELPRSVTTLGSSAFRGCTSLKSVILPDDMVEIPSNAFADCTMLTSVNFPSKLEKINARAFQNCASLGKIKLPDSLTYIANAAFENCTSMTLDDPHLPDGLRVISKKAFANCKSITEVILPDTMTSFSTDSLTGTSISYLVLPNTKTLTKFVSSAYADYECLEYIVLKKNINKIVFYESDQYYKNIDFFYEGSIEDLRSVLVEYVRTDETRITVSVALLNINFYCYSESQPTTEGKYWGYEGSTIKKYY